MSTDTFAYRLKTRREELNYSRKGLAEESNIPENTIRNLESGKTKFPRADTLFMLSDILDISPQYLLYGGSKMNAYTDSIIKEMANLSYDQINEIKETDKSNVAVPKLANATAIKEVKKIWDSRNIFTGNKTGIAYEPYVQDAVYKYCQNRKYFKKKFNLE
ncbi:MAG: helix-turn-helix domain-containing protein [Candidatus Fimenecus sp.]